jgi:hypothetical protein
VGERFGLQLAGSPADVAALTGLGEAASDLVDQAWIAVLAGDGVGSVVVSPILGPARAEDLARRGIPIVAVTEIDEDVELRTLVGRPIARRWTAPTRRPAPRLIEAIRLRRLPGEPLVDEALFVAPVEARGLQRLMERLLLLERGDVQVCGFTDGDGSASLAVKVKAPPVYLLMAARDGEGGLSVYARGGSSPLWVAWSFEHPLAPAAVAALTRVGQAALVEPSGAWRRLPAEFRPRSIYDSVTPVLDAADVSLRPAEIDVRFPIPLRLVPGPVADADLWLLTPDDLLALGPLVEACTSDELGRLTLARLTGDDGTRYLLRERVRPGAARMAARVSDALGLGGYVQVAGADNLYVPSGRKLVPLLRRDDLRRLLGLERAHAVVLTEDRDGPRIVRVLEVDEAPLHRFIDYVATDRRLELDRLLERTVFEFPEVTIEWPEARRSPVERPPSRERRPEVTKRVEVRRDEPKEEAQAEVVEPSVRLAELRARARELEAILAAGGCDDPAPWAELGGIKVELGELDEAAACLETALLHGGPPYDRALARELSAVSVGMSDGAGSEDQLMELVVSDRRTPAESARLGALLLARMADGLPPADEVMQLALPGFLDPRLPVARRLAWTVAAAWYHHARDRLGLTRAREAILGGINERGLSELHDLPRFVRAALAREGAGDPAEARGDRLQHGQLVALEALWHMAVAGGLPEIDVHANYVRLIFAVGFARLGARATAQEIVAPIEAELDVHEAPNRALFKLYGMRLAHETAGGSAEAWAADVEKVMATVRDAKHRQAAQWLQKRSMWLRPSGEDDSLVGRPTRFKLPPTVPVDGLAEHLAREMSPSARNFDYIVAEAVDVVLRRALASGSEAIVAGVLAGAEPGLGNIEILSHRAEAIGACIHGAAVLGDDALLGRLLDALVDVARSKKLGSARELARAVERGLVALRRHGGVEPARGLLEALAEVHAYTEADRVTLHVTVAKGFVQLGEEPAADALLGKLIERILGGTLDYVTRAQAGVAVAGALRHWPNAARVERLGKLFAALHQFRDTFTTGRFFDTHKIMMLEAIVDSLADSQTRHSDKIQAYLDQEEHALRRRILTDWSAVCGR